MLRSALRAVLAMAALPEVCAQPRFALFLTKVVNAGAMAAKYAAVKAEAEGGAAAAEGAQRQ